MVAIPWKVTSTGPGRFINVCIFYDGISQRLNGKWFYGEAGNRIFDPWFTRHRFIPYTIASSEVEGGYVIIILQLTINGLYIFFMFVGLGLKNEHLCYQILKYATFCKVALLIKVKISMICNCFACPFIVCFYISWAGPFHKTAR